MRQPLIGERRQTGWRGYYSVVRRSGTETCRKCGGSVRSMPKALAARNGQPVVCIENPVVIERILTYLQEKLTPAPILSYPLMIRCRVTKGHLVFPVLIRIASRQKPVVNLLFPDFARMSPNGPD